MRVLLIDDEPMVRKIVRKMLVRAGHEVVDAENGRAGLEQLARSEFDLVVTDLIMPEMEGIETVMAVREQFPAVAIIAMSGGGRTGNIDFLEVARNQGASGILHKPFTAGNLDDAIKQAFDATKSA